MERSDRGGGGFVDAVEQGLGVALQDGERGAQLVGNVSEQVAAELVLAIEVVGHFVEGVGEAAELAGGIGEIGRCLGGRPQAVRPRW